MKIITTKMSDLENADIIEAAQMLINTCEKAREMILCPSPALREEMKTL